MDARPPKTRHLIHAGSQSTLRRVGANYGAATLHNGGFGITETSAFERMLVGSKIMQHDSSIEASRRVGACGRFAQQPFAVDLQLGKRSTFPSP